MDHLCRGLFGELQRYAGRRLGAQEPLGYQPGDVAQSALLRFSRSFHAFRGSTAAELRAYAFTIVDHLMEGYRRAANRDKRDERLTVALEEQSFEGVAEQLRQSEQLRRKEQVQSVWAVLPRLTERQAQALILRYEGAPLREIGEALGLDEKAAANVLGRAILAVQRELGGTFQGEASPEEGRVLHAFRQYLYAVERGQAPEVAAFVAGYPDVAPALRELLDGLEATFSALRAAVADEDRDGV
jgi:RNA polymerase sigma factor (sigma-70 family)